MEARIPLMGQVDHMGRIEPIVPETVVAPADRTCAGCAGVGCQRTWLFQKALQHSAWNSLLLFAMSHSKWLLTPWLHTIWWR